MRPLPDIQFFMREREMPRPPVKPALVPVTLHLRADRVELIDALLLVAHQSRNGWISGLIDSALPRLASLVDRKRKNLHARRKA